MKTPTKNEMIEAARNEYQREGEIEIDDDAKVSRAKGNPEHGAYVQAWIWVSDDEAANIKPVCGFCSEETEEVQSTYCGSACNECLAKHCEECEVCAKDFA